MIKGVSIKTNKGITLIALVITIVVLIILATVVINISLGQNGIFNRAKLARQEYINAQSYETEQVNAIDSKIANSLNGKANDPENKTYTITFNPNGGQVTTSSKTVINGEKYNELPTPQKTAYTFTGWYTHEENGTEINENVIVNITENQTLYAHWSLNEYINSGLILYLDGINNSSNGHQTSISTWKDLSTSSNDATLYNCTIENDNVSFNGSTSYATLPTNAFGSYGASTIEVVAKVNNSSVIVADNDNVSSRGLGLSSVDNVAYISTAIGDKSLPTISGSLGSNRFNSTFSLFSNKNMYTIEYDGQNYGNTKVYVNATEATKTDSINGFSNTATYPMIGRRFYGNGSNVTQWPLNGNIYAIRVYNRKLTESEIQNNYEIDKVRFGIQ